MVFFGDSITQHMREPSNWPVFQKYFASKYRAYPLGVGSAPRASCACHCVATVAADEADKFVSVHARRWSLHGDTAQRKPQPSLLACTGHKSSGCQPSGAPHH